MAEPSAEGLQRAGGVVLAAVEAAVDERLDASSQPLEERSNGQGRCDYGKR